MLRVGFAAALLSLTACASGPESPEDPAPAPAESAVAASRASPRAYGRDPACGVVIDPESRGGAAIPRSEALLPLVKGSPWAWGVTCTQDGSVVPSLLFSNIVVVLDEGVPAADGTRRYESTYTQLLPVPEGSGETVTEYALLLDPKLGLLSRGADETELRLDVPLPLTVGLRWTGAMDELPTRWTVVGVEALDFEGRRTEEAVRVDFECLDMEQESAFQGSSWYLPELGEVRRIRRFPQLGFREEVEMSLGDEDQPR